MNFKAFTFIFCLLLLSCNTKNDMQINNNLAKYQPLALGEEQAQKIMALPMHCLLVEYPNKLGQVLNEASELKSPKALRPVFYGCFDWHSSVHGYWSIITLLKQFPEMDADSKIAAVLNQQITPENVQVEIDFFNQPHNKSFERTYGWAWFLKLQQALQTWDNPQAQQWHKTLQPLEEIIVTRYTDYLQKLVYPIRTGTHDNSAFSLALLHEYATTTNNEILLQTIKDFALKQYGNDVNCPIAYEPSGHDFLSPCLQEAWLMSKILDTDAYRTWLKQFMSSLFNSEFDLQVAQVADRTDGHLVHLDGLNFSRATCLFEIANKLPELQHLKPLGAKHFNAAFPNISDDDYMGSHWLGTFALQALQAQ
ncbi:DUF2891 domain-containing protein [Flavobacterium agricola]|uniref:DUF2891 domain-containing protein n=1 Tax=Flavobacterium agricola TaxID=2870839 RepID=A0ABY6LZT1_9FLAO|nr:DUF2891 domain-containing protein [Flavobacterium agricola]UYW01711.1 DUF2891 domain-containing protein [Flavobacterium agricola]